MKKRLLLRAINAWPPFLGAGIRVKRMTSKAIDVEMKLRRWNRNYVGTHFGGSLYSMTDPFFMLMLIENLGPEYIVWDKSATIRFKKPGRGKVRAEFRLSSDQVEEIRRAVAANGKTEPTFIVQVKDAAGEVVAEVEKVLWVRRKADAAHSSTEASFLPSK
jgi:acyl-coenzyme A thioesterase PaaI-like protein